MTLNLDQQPATNTKKPDWKIWRDEILRTIASFCSCFLVAYLMSFVQILGDERMIAATESGAVKPLPDLGLDFLPHPVWWPKAAADIVLNSFIVISLVACTVSCWKQRRGMMIVLIYVRRTLWLFACCYFLRLLALGGTTLPSSSDQCLLVKRSVADYLSTGPKILVGKAQTCTDKLFSGHTALATLLVWFWAIVFGTKSTLLAKIVWRTYALLHGSGVFIASLMCRHHYTVDVVLAIIIASLVFHVYHMILWVKEGHDRGLGYFTVKYGGRPSQVYLHRVRVVEEKQADPISMEEGNADFLGQSKLMDNPISPYDPNANRAPLVARAVFTAVGWMEGLDIRQL